MMCPSKRLFYFLLFFSSLVIAIPCYGADKPDYKDLENTYTTNYRYKVDPNAPSYQINIQHAGFLGLPAKASFDAVKVLKEWVETSNSKINGKPSAKYEVSIVDVVLDQDKKDEGKRFAVTLAFKADDGRVYNASGQTLGLFKSVFKKKEKRAENLREAYTCTFINFQNAINGNFVPFTASVPEPEAEEGGD